MTGGIQALFFLRPPWVVAVDWLAGDRLLSWDVVRLMDKKPTPTCLGCVWVSKRTAGEAHTETCKNRIEEIRARQQHFRSAFKVVETGSAARTNVGGEFVNGQFSAVDSIINSGVAEVVEDVHLVSFF